MVFASSGTSNAEVLAEQAAAIHLFLTKCAAFPHVVDVIRRSAINKCDYSMPHDKHVQVFEQFTPVGSSRVVADASDIDEHVLRATAAKAMPRRDMRSVLQTDLASAICVVASYADSPEVLQKKRSVVESIIDWADKALAPLSVRLRAMAPAHVRRLPTTINVALVAALCEAMEWPDKLLPAKLLFGSPTTGDLPPSNVMRPKVRRATVDPRTFDVPGWAASLHASVAQRGRRMSAKARKAAAAVLAKSIDEAKPDAAGRSWSSGPLSLQELLLLFPDGYWPSRRFGVLQKGAVRPCDDNRESRLNDSLDAVDSISPDTADMPATIASVFYELLGARAVLHGGCDDWKKAYRQIPTSDPSRSVVALWDPDNKCVVYFVVWGHCFGQLSAVNSFNAVSKFLTCMSRMLFAHVGGNYFDDHFTVEPAYMGSSGQHGLGRLAFRLGFLFDPDKHVKMAPSFVYLGVEHDLSCAPSGTVYLRILEKRRADLIDLCQSVLKRGVLHPGQAATLRGKLYFAASTAYGKVGRAALQPIIQRQERPGVDTRLTRGMVAALRFFITLLRHMPAREVALGEDPRRPLIVWSDAAWEKGVGSLGWVVYDPDSGEYVHSAAEIPSHILDLFVRKKQKIGQCEILAANVPYYSLPDLFRGRQVVHWIDNTSAISCLIHGYSNKPDSALLVNAFNLFNAGLRCRIHFEYVESKANVADLPSRNSFLYLTDVLGSRFVPTECLEAATWEGPLRAFIALGGATSVRRRNRKRAGAPGHVRARRMRVSPS